MWSVDLIAPCTHHLMLFLSSLTRLLACSSMLAISAASHPITIRCSKGTRCGLVSSLLGTASSWYLLDRDSHTHRGKLLPVFAKNSATPLTRWRHPRCFPSSLPAHACFHGRQSEEALSSSHKLMREVSSSGGGVGGRVMRRSCRSFGRDIGIQGSFARATAIASSVSSVIPSYLMNIPSCLPQKLLALLT